MSGKHDVERIKLNHDKVVFRGIATRALRPIATEPTTAVIGGCLLAAAMIVTDTELSVEDQIATLHQLVDLAYDMATEIKEEKS